MRITWRRYAYISRSLPTKSSDGTISGPGALRGLSPSTASSSPVELDESLGDLVKGERVFCLLQGDRILCNCSAAG